jgi:CRISPR system Cascade subunit CasA
MDGASPPISIKGQPGGITYRHWCGLALPDERAKRNCAQVVSTYLQSRSELINDNAAETQLWISGFDMDNAKARCWYETTLPLYAIPAERREWVADFARTLTEAAASSSNTLKKYVKDASLSKKSKAKPDLGFIGSTLLELTEAKFFQFLKQIITCDEPEETSVELKDRWRSLVGREAIAIFDEHVLATTETPSSLLDLTRVRTDFMHALWGNKTMRTLKKPEDSNGTTQ